MLEIAPGLDSDDGAVIIDQYCQGPGPITAACANLSALPDEEDFIDAIKLAVNEIGQADVDCPKVLFLISDDYSPVCQRNIVKMQRRIAKHANFAFMGGAAAKRYAAMVFSLSDGEIVLDLKEAAHVRALWKQTWREEKEYFDYINGCSDGRGFFDILQARVPRLRRGCTRPRRSTK